MPGDKTYLIVVGVVEYRGKVLFLRRAENRHFAPGKWEFVSGYAAAKEAAEDAVQREIEEETGLQTTLLRRGAAYEVDGDGALWVIKPFLLVSTTDTVSLDGEHTTYCWLDPSEASALDGVDELLKNLQQLGVA